MARRTCGCALAAGLLALGCGARPPPNLLLVVSDSLRADALDCRDASDRTPHACGLASRGVLFERAYATAPWTLPSAVSIFTGGYPSSYRAAGARSVAYHVRDEEPLLAEVLAGRGYDVLRFLENELVAQPNVLQGFSDRSFERLAAFPHVYRALRHELGIRVDDPRYHRSLSLLFYLRRLAREPFFVAHWILDPHAQYAPPGEFVREIPVDEARLPRPLAFYSSLSNRDADGGSERDLDRERPGLSDYERWYLRQLYAKEVESVDERLGHVLAALERAGLAGRTLVIFTSDHGEGFGEHGLFLHGNSLYEELLRVPLVVAGPGIGAGRRVARPVSHADLAPTLAELLGAGRLAGAQGHSFAALLHDEPDPVVDRVAYAVGPRGSEALVDGRHKLIRRGTGELALYDLDSDPGERRDLSDELPGIAGALEGRLAGLRGEAAERSERNRALLPRALRRQVARETRSRMRALGYLE